MQPKRVLLVEDHPVIALGLKMEIEDRGFNVVGPASHGAQALALAQNEQLDAALLDVRLADGDSFSAARILKQRGVPFIFLTGFDDTDAFPSELAGAPRLTKPIEMVALFGFLEGLA